MENNQNLYFKILFFVPYLLWSIIILLYVFYSDLIKAGELDGLIKLGNDSSRYIDEAERLANFDFTNIYLSKLSYIIILAITFKLNLDLSTVVIFQFLTTIISSLCLYLIAQKIFSKWVGLLSMLIFLAYLPIQLRNFYILTEILFINFCIILTYLFFFKRHFKIMILLIGLFILFLRPQGILVLLSISFASIMFIKLNRNYNFIIKLMIIILCFVLTIFLIHNAIQEYNFISALSKGMIWGYSFETNDICYSNCIPGLTNPDLYEKNVIGLIQFFKDNFFILIKVSFFKIILFFTGWRPYYSNIHNIFLICFHLPIYIMFCAYFFKSKKLISFEIFTLFYIFLSVAFVSVTFVDWSGRFIMYIFPFMIIFASKSATSLFLLFLDRAKIK